MWHTRFYQEACGVRFKKTLYKKLFKFVESRVIRCGRPEDIKYIE